MLEAGLAGARNLLCGSSLPTLPSSRPTAATLPLSGALTRIVNRRCQQLTIVKTFRKRRRPCARVLPCSGTLLNEIQAGRDRVRYRSDAAVVNRSPAVAAKRSCPVHAAPERVGSHVIHGPRVLRRGVAGIDGNLYVAVIGVRVVVDV